MDVAIRPATEADIDGLHAALEAVARERKYLARIEAPPVEEMREWIRGNIEKGNPQFVAVERGKIVGWCDITPGDRTGFQHAGRLGMGVLSEHRRRGIGAKLLAAVLEAARAAGLERVGLGVFASNRAAIVLYERHGFAHEGRRRKARKIDGQYDDLVFMGLILKTGER